MGLGSKLTFASRQAGQPFELSPVYTDETLNDTTKTEVKRYLNQPMLAEITFVPTIGDIDGYRTTSYKPHPADIAATEYYDTLRSANASVAEFEANDVFLITYAFAELYAMHAECVRDVKLILKNEWQNAAYPRLFREAIDRNGTIRANLSNHVARLNAAANDLKRFPVIKGIPMFDDLISICSNVIHDDDMIKGGAILFKHQKFLYLDTDAESKYVGSLRYQAVADKLTRLEELIAAYASDTDVHKVSAEIMKVYGKQSYTCEILDENKLVDTANALKPVFSWELVDRIKNSSIFDITCKPNSSSTLAEGIGIKSNGLLGYGLIPETGLAQGPMYAEDYNETTHTQSAQRVKFVEQVVPIFCHVTDPSEEAVNVFIANTEMVYCPTVQSYSTRGRIMGLSLIHFAKGQLYVITDDYSVIHDATMAFATLPQSNIGMTNIGYDNFDNENGFNTIANKLDNISKYLMYGCLPPLKVLWHNDKTDLNAMGKVITYYGDIDNWAPIDWNTLSILKMNQIRAAFYLSPSASAHDKGKSGGFHSTKKETVKDSKDSK